MPSPAFAAAARRRLSPAALLAVLAAALLAAPGAAPDGRAADGEVPAEDGGSRHMVAEAMLAARFIDAAVRAGMGAEEIDAALAGIAAQTAISEFWISDEDGRIEYGTVAGTGFAFPTDPAAGTQAAPFAALLRGEATVVVQEAQPREYDGRVFKYVGAAGIDRPRIVQVGIEWPQAQESDGR